MVISKRKATSNIKRKVWSLMFTPKPLPLAWLEYFELQKECNSKIWTCMFWPADCFFPSSFSHFRWGLESWNSLFKPVKNTSSNLYNHFNFVENLIRGTLLCWSQPAELLTQSFLVQPCQTVIALLGKIARGHMTLVSLFYVLLAQDKLAWTQKEPQPHQSLSVCGLRLISLSSSLAKHRLS